MAEKVRCEECDRNFPNMDALSMHNAAKHSNNKPISKEGIRLTNKNILISGVIVILLIIVYLIAYDPLGKNTGSVVNENNIQNIKESTNAQDSNDIQKITLGMKGNYYPNTINVKSGIPVEITLDSSVRGCYRAFNIPELGVSKRSLNPADTIKFTPNKKGTFRFQCSMAMGTGTIIVE